MYLTEKRGPVNARIFEHYHVNTVIIIEILSTGKANELIFCIFNGTNFRRRDVLKSASGLPQI